MSSYVLSPRPLRTALREHGQRASADPVRIEEHSREGRATERVVTGGAAWSKPLRRLFWSTFVIFACLVNN